MKKYGGVDVHTHVFLTSALVGDEWSPSRPGRFTPGVKDTVPLEYEARWAPEPVWTIWRSENSCPHRDTNSDLFVVHPVASRVTGCAIPALIYIYTSTYI
jgi:hypothetical protein